MQGAQGRAAGGWNWGWGRWLATWWGGKRGRAEEGEGGHGEEGWRSPCANVQQSQLLTCPNHVHSAPATPHTSLPAQVPAFLGAGARHFGFMLRGLKELAPRLEQMRVPFFLLRVSLVCLAQASCCSRCGVLCLFLLVPGAEQLGVPSHTLSGVLRVPEEGPEATIHQKRPR